MYVGPEEVQAAWTALRPVDPAAAEKRFVGDGLGPAWESSARRTVREAWAFVEQAAAAGDGVLHVAG